MSSVRLFINISILTYYYQKNPLFLSALHEFYFFSFSFPPLFFLNQIIDRTLSDLGPPRYATVSIYPMPGSNVCPYVPAHDF